LLPPYFEAVDRQRWNRAVGHAEPVHSIAAVTNGRRSIAAADSRAKF